MTKDLGSAHASRAGECALALAMQDHLNLFHLLRSPERFGEGAETCTRGACAPQKHSPFELRHSFVIRHSTFVISHNGSVHDFLSLRCGRPDHAWCARTEDCARRVSFDV